jgi:all-trans-8'-apo-beta-carotenal 15,15'-oxygenase
MLHADALSPQATTSTPSTSPRAAVTVTQPQPRFDPPWLGALQDLAREHAFEPLAVRGTLPEGLQGTLYRNGPGRFGVGGERFGHWFDGDGAVSSVRIAGGKALGASRLVRTRGLEREERAGRRLYGGYGTPLARPFREMLLGDGKNTANTSVLLWQDRLFATCEAGKPYEVDPESLATLGERDLGVVAKAFSAHSHYVPSRRCTYNFGLRHGRKTTVDVYALPDDGTARVLASFDIEGARLNHDFAATGKHLVFVLAPAYLSLYRTMVQRRPPVASSLWKPERGTEIVVVPLDAPEKIRRFRVDAFMLEHVANAYDGGDRVIVDYTHYAHPDGLESFVGGLVDGRVGAPLGSELRRMTIDVDRASLSTEVLSRRAVELPRVSPVVDAEPHRFVYAVGFAARAADGVQAALLKVDASTGRSDAYDPGEGHYAGEGVFVPRPGGASEDDGWLLTMVYDARRDRSRLEVLDARGVADGPIASCEFDHPIPLGFHGAWKPAEA